MEQNNYLISLGARVVEERSKRKMNQVEFYRFLFPDNPKEEETIKKKMNKIENAKQKTIDFDFVYVLCEKCNLGLDYLFGKQVDFKCHEIEFVNGYTGLSANSIEQLHEWKKGLDDDIDINLFKDGFLYLDGNDIDPDYLFNRVEKKKTGIQFIKIINYLFEGGEESKGKRKEKYSNLSILYSIYNMCLSTPKEIMGISNVTPNNYEPISRLNQIESCYIKPYDDGSILLRDSEDVWRPVNSRDLIIQMAKNKLDKQLDRLIEHINKQ